MQAAAQASRAASAGPGSLQRRLLNARLRLSGGQGILLQTVWPLVHHGLRGVQPCCLMWLPGMTLLGKGLCLRLHEESSSMLTGQHT